VSDALIARFAAACAAIGCNADVRDVGSAVVASWSSAGRVYHDLSHLQASLALFEEVRGHAQRPAEVEIAFFFHDAIYETRAVDNEARSASWAREVLEGAGAPAESVDRVEGAILATRLSAEPPTPDAALLVDLDRSILGADAAVFDTYERGVREEYAWVEESQYIAARMGVLERLAARTPLFKTAACARFEAPARANIARSLASLRDIASG